MFQYFAVERMVLEKVVKNWKIRFLDLLSTIKELNESGCTSGIQDLF